MKFEATQSRSLVIKKGQATERFKLYVQKEEIPSIVTSPIKCMGKRFDASIQDRDNIKKLEQQVEKVLKKTAADYPASSKLDSTSTLCSQN
ncbi:hypothetical protein DPMN_136737 [Dreissena polymorpha]|uniref:Uncharacterized protein n=1 Tax=Dreissena polymorpha TaxID=45954 RepID=A0A9D4JFT8_DREPO|nr:hypothetical protein DPMN_136737 [Dreissena polymorpha]